VRRLRPRKYEQEKKKKKKTRRLASMSSSLSSNSFCLASLFAYAPTESKLSFSAELRGGGGGVNSQKKKKEEKIKTRTVIPPSQSPRLLLPQTSREDHRRSGGTGSGQTGQHLCPFPCWDAGTSLGQGLWGGGHQGACCFSG